MSLCRRAALVVALLAGCASAPPPDPVAPPSDGGPSGPTPPGDRPERARGRSLEAIAAVPPRTLAAVHLAHLAQLELARRDPRNDFTDRMFTETWSGLGEALGSELRQPPTAEDLALVRDFADAAPARVVGILEALTSSGMPDVRRRVSPSVARVIDDIVLDGPPAAKVWALRTRWGGAGRDARTFTRSMLARAAATGRCPVADETVGRAIDALYGDRRGIPCLEGATVSEEELVRHTVAELLALIDTGGQAGEAAAIALRTKVQEADGGTPGALAALLGPEEFGHLIELAARDAVERSCVVQLLSSAHNEPAWVDWLAEHPDRVGPSERAFAVMLLEQEGPLAGQERRSAALARLRAATSTLPPAGRDFMMPDDSPATLEATWRLAATAAEIGPIEGVYGALMGRSVSDPAAKALAARHDVDIATALSRCQALVQARPAGSWIERTLQEATTDACTSVVRLAVNVYTPRLRTALLDALRTGPDPWVREVYGTIELFHREADVPAGVMDAVLARPAVRQRVLMLVSTEALWTRLPAPERTEEAVLRMVARSHAAPLLGATPDRVGAPEPAPGVRGVARAYFVEVSSSELPDVPPVRLLLGVMSPARELRPIDVARMVP